MVGIHEVYDELQSWWWLMLTSGSTENAVALWQVRLRCACLQPMGNCQYQPAWLVVNPSQQLEWLIITEGWYALPPPAHGSPILSAQHTFCFQAASPLRRAPSPPDTGVGERRRCKKNIRVQWVEIGTEVVFNFSARMCPGTSWYQFWAHHSSTGNHHMVVS